MNPGRVSRLIPGGFGVDLGPRTTKTQEGRPMARVALVTGGQRGIGEAISEALKAAGRTVVASYAGNDAAAQEFTRRTNIPCFKFDVSDYAQCEQAVKRI